MKRFHVHVSVEDLQRSIRFYSAMFGAEPSVVKPDYAKWMLEDPRVNFAISQRGVHAGLNHLGFQVDSGEELRALRARADEAESAVFDQQDAACCYARSDKYWITDPEGIAWETFHTLDSIPVFGADTQSTAAQEPSMGCCVAEPATTKSVRIPVVSATGKCC